MYLHALKNAAFIGIYLISDVEMSIIYGASKSAYTCKYIIVGMY